MLQVFFPVCENVAILTPSTVTADFGVVVKFPLQQLSRFQPVRQMCALLLCVLILDEKCFQREAFTLQHEGKYWCVHASLLPWYVCAGRTGAGGDCYFSLCTLERLQQVRCALNCGNNDVASFVSSTSTTHTKETQFDITREILTNVLSFSFKWS